MDSVVKDEPCAYPTKAE